MYKKEINLLHYCALPVFGAPLGIVRVSVPPTAWDGDGVRVGETVGLGVSVVVGVCPNTTAAAILAENTKVINAITAALTIHIHLLSTVLSSR